MAWSHQIVGGEVTKSIRINAVWESISSGALSFCIRDGSRMEGGEEDADST